MNNLYMNQCQSPFSIVDYIPFISIGGTVHIRLSVIISFFFLPEMSKFCT